MGFGERLIKLREGKGVARKEFAEKLQLPYTTLRNYETNQREPGHKTLINMASILGVTVDDLVGYHAKKGSASQYSCEALQLAQDYEVLDTHGKKMVRMVTDEEKARCIALKVKREHARSQTEESPEFGEERTLHYFPMYNSPMSAGTGLMAGQEFPETTPLVKKPPEGASYIAPVSGDSMEPTYEDGDLLFIRATPQIEVGQVGVFLMDGQQWVKELGDGVLISHNEEYAPIPMTEDIICQGLVLGVCDESYF